MIYYHKNPLFKSMLFVIKFQYRDEKRIKFRGQLIDEKFRPLWNIESYKVNPDFFLKIIQQRKVKVFLILKIYLF